MSDRVDGTEDSADAMRPNDPVESVELYREDDTVVLFDSHNPLAWMEATVAVSLADQT
jgi:hypothetical protein